MSYFCHELNFSTLMSILLLGRGGSAVFDIQMLGRNPSGIVTSTLHRSQSQGSIMGHNLMMMMSMQPSVELDGPANVDMSQFQNWTVTLDVEMPTDETTYYCKLYKTADALTSPRHVAGFSVKQNPAALKYIHHGGVFQCRFKTKKIRDLAERLVKGQGGSCFSADYANLSPLCASVTFIFGHGRSDHIFYPENAGLLINENGDGEFFIVQYHMTNEERVTGISLSIEVTAYMTDHLREHNMANMLVGSYSSPTLIIPPNSRDFIVAAHCSPVCTQKYFPPTGIYIVSHFLHAHLNGREIVLRHFRPTLDPLKNGTFMEELPPIGHNKHYTFEYQPDVWLSKPVQVLPGDQLTLECHYDSAWKQPKSATLGGITSYDEMCQVFLNYYPQVKGLDRCRSIIRPDVVKQSLGILGVDQHHGASVNPVITSPESMAGKTLTTVLNAIVDWERDGFRNEFQTATRFADQIYTCSPGNGGNEDLDLHSLGLEFWKNSPHMDWPLVSYPKIESN